MKQKLIFLDIDGTLLPPGEMLIPQSTVEALRKARANGHKLFLCTGRRVHAGSAGRHLRQPEDDRALELHPPGCRPSEQRGCPLAQGHGGRHDH